jgi:hypothetical protein
VILYPSAQFTRGLRKPAMSGCAQKKSNHEDVRDVFDSHQAKYNFTFADFPSNHINRTNDISLGCVSTRKLKHFHPA